MKDNGTERKDHMDTLEATDQLNVQEPPAATNSNPPASIERDDVPSKGDEAADGPRKISKMSTKSGSDKTRRRTISKPAKSDVPAAMKSRVRDLFYLQSQSSEEIKETLQGEWPKMSEKDISELAESTLRDEMGQGLPDGNGNRYIFTNSGLFKLSRSGDEVEAQKLANFRCLSLTPIGRDDGLQRLESLRLEVQYKDQRATIDLTLDEFRQMNWYIRLFDQQAIVTPRMKEHALVGIQLATPRNAPITIYTSTGWFLIDKQPYFLHNDGAIGAKEHRRDIKAELKENLRFYSLPDPPTGEALKSAIRASLKFLEVGEPAVAIPMFASILRAPLGNVDFVGWANGVTNTLKTSHAVVAQQFYGKDFDKKHLPATWSSTANFNLSRLHAAKDVFTAIDDFVLRGSSPEQQKQKAEADRFVRGVADGAFRGRLDARHSDDAPSRGPRGLAWSTAETNPLGHSGQARLASVTYRRNDGGIPISIDPVKLRESQREAKNGTYSDAMAGYLQFLAQRHDGLFQRVQDRIQELTAAMSASLNGQLLRTAEVSANLAVGIEYFLIYAKSVGVIDDEKYQSIWAECWQTLVSLGEIQTQHLHNEDPVRESLRLLRSADLAGQLVFGSPDSEAMPEFSGPKVDIDQHRTNGFVGWRKNAESPWLCNPDQLWRVIQALHREQGHQVPKKKVELFAEMEQGGWITSRDEPRRVGTPTVKRDIGGKRVRVIEIPIKSFERLEGADNLSHDNAIEIPVPDSPPKGWDSPAKLGPRK